MTGPRAPRSDQEAPLPSSLQDYEALARAAAEPPVWDFIEGGSDDEVTLRANRAAFQRIVLRPRVLTGSSACDLSSTALGVELRWPVMVAPIGCQGIAHPEGEHATARAAGAASTLMAVSTMSSRSLEEIAAAATGPLWFQLYVMKDRALTVSLVRRAEEAGYRALVVTVDTPRLGRRERDLRNGFALPQGLALANLTSDSSAPAHQHRRGTSALALHAAAAFEEALSWKTVEWLRSQTSLPVVLKGILTAEDATRAVDAGVQGIIVSNHGGRQLDGVAATIDALEEVASAVGPHCEVFLDGGIRRGTDVLKARARGARAVFVGRPVLWGLLARGEAGVLHVLELLRAEIELGMVLAGRSSWESVDRTLVEPPDQRSPRDG